MEDIMNKVKILLLIDAIAAFFFCFLYLIITDIYLIDFSKWTYPDPYFPKAFGGTLLVLGIFALLAIRKEKWEQIKIFIELVITWMMIIFILNILELIFIDLTFNYYLNTILDSLVLAFLIILNLYYYIKQQNKL
jgi:hypothetical protein